MTDIELFHVLALLKVEGVGDVLAKKLIRNFGTAEAVFKASKKHLLSIEGIGEVLFRALRSQSVFPEADLEMEFIRKNKIEVLYFLEEDYPERLKHCYDAPVLLFSKGNTKINRKKSLSIVGTRTMTGYGSEFCKNLIEELRPMNPVIVSGFAYGVDICAHLAALDNGMQTIAVLAHGLNQVYPKAHSKYVNRLLEKGGLLTEFWSCQNPDRENFVRRNRIVAGMTEATLVIESASKGGSLITASLANDYGREVFAVPGRVTDKFSQGCNYLIRTQQAHLVTSVSDLKYILNWEESEGKGKTSSVQKQLFVDMDEEEQKIYDYLSVQGKELIDIIAMECTIPVFRVSGLLLSMELKGVIRPLPGKYFEAI